VGEWVSSQAVSNSLECSSVERSERSIVLSGVSVK
jgi:hypothetical protein